MGKEDFFVNIYDENLNPKTREVFLYLTGNSKNIDDGLLSKIKENNINIAIEKKNKVTFNNCIEAYIWQNNEDVISIDLLGCLSCFDFAVKQIEALLKSINSIENAKIKYRAFGKDYIFEEKSFYNNVFDLYKDRYKKFQISFPNASFIVIPSRFYKEYYGIIYRSLRILKRYF